MYTIEFHITSVINIGQNVELNTSEYKKIHRIIITNR